MQDNGAVPFVRRPTRGRAGLFRPCGPLVFRPRVLRPYRRCRCSFLGQPSRARFHTARGMISGAVGGDDELAPGLTAMVETFGQSRHRQAGGHASVARGGRDRRRQRLSAPSLAPWRWYGCAQATASNDHRSCRIGGVHQQGSKIHLGFLIHGTAARPCNRGLRQPKPPSPRAIRPRSTVVGKGEAQRYCCE